jgi:hypothetical protein
VSTEGVLDQISQQPVKAVSRCRPVKLPRKLPGKQIDVVDLLAEHPADGASQEMRRNVGNIGHEALCGSRGYAVCLLVVEQRALRARGGAIRQVP